ncbi:MAG: C69 family dipeptidase [Bacteroidales bacterium]|nr:C69 family dipeptidase [Bacteroidales bacterium]
MKRILLLTSCLLFAGWQAVAQSENPFNCFSVLAGKEATLDGSVMFAHNEDDWGDRIVNWYKVPAQKHAFNEKILLKNGGIAGQVGETWDYLWLEMPEMEFSDAYMNQWGVTIASDQCLSREDTPELTDGGIGYWLRRLMAERARTAREAVKIGGRLIERYGYTASGRTYCIADPNEAWMLGVVSGKRWVAQKIPDNHVAIIPNYYTIGEVDLNDTANFMGSSDIINYAAERGWYNPDEGEAFNFREAYSDPGILHSPDNTIRHLSALTKLSGKEYRLEDVFPFSFEPEKLIHVKTLFEVLRNHNEGTEYDASEHYTKGNPHAFGRPICAETTQYGFVAHLRSSMPAEIGAVLWVAPFRPCVHAFLPWYQGIQKIPEGFTHRNAAEALETHFLQVEDLQTYAPEHHFLKLVDHARAIDTNYIQLAIEAQSAGNSLEESLFIDTQSFEEEIVPMFEDNKEEALRMITDFCLEKIMESMEIYNK